MTIEQIDWTLWQSFEAVAQTGSLSAGAKKIGISQPTIGRHIVRLEGILREQLFIRHAKGLHLSEFGERLVPAVGVMHQAALDLDTLRDAQSDVVQGTVRITSSENVCLKILPSIIADLRKTHPQLMIEMIPNDTSENLLYGDADLAIRLYRPRQMDLVTKFVGDLELGLFASPRYLDTVKTPLSIEGIGQFDLVGFDTDDRMIDGFRTAGIPITRNDFATRTDSSVLQWELVKVGCGIGIGIAPVGRRDPDLVEIPIPIPEKPSMPVWLASSVRARHTKRVAAAWDSIECGLKDWVTSGAA